MPSLVAHDMKSINDAGTVTGSGSRATYPNSGILLREGHCCLDTLLVSCLSAECIGDKFTASRTDRRDDIMSTLEIL